MPVLLIVVVAERSFPQHLPIKSVHQEQQEYYRSNPWPVQEGVDASIQKYTDCSLEKMVFGYHPYWMGNNYLNYQWDLISDMCFFSYEVDASNGYPISTHNWLDAPVVDSAYANDVRVHLCVTLFHGHAYFFSNETARQNLIDYLIYLVSERKAHGINLDIEAVPSSQGEAMVDYVLELSSQVKDTLPGCIISMAMPAVDWNGIFNIPRLDDAIDLFMIMGYDYYWNGSSSAGPVSPLYSMTSGYDYSLSRTVSYYQEQGIPVEKFLLGVPYYGRQWRTQYPLAPSPVLAFGTALTYANVKNSGADYYEPINRQFEQSSISTYYSFNLNDDWNQCFVAEPMDLSERYDIVNYRGLAGIGIWALGYDNGYDHLWNVIADKFSDCKRPMYSDTLYDSGGPSWSYYDNENYTLTLESYENTSLELEFLEFDLEDGFDSLWVYDGADTSGVLLGAFSGLTLPPLIESSSTFLTLWFRSDGMTTRPGWKAVWRSGSAGIYERNPNPINIYPNPTSSVISYKISDISDRVDCRIEIWDLYGRWVESILVPPGQETIRSDVSGYAPGVYFAIVRSGKGISGMRKIVIE